MVGNYNNAFHYWFSFSLDHREKVIKLISLDTLSCRYTIWGNKAAVVLTVSRNGNKDESPFKSIFIILLMTITMREFNHDKPLP